MTSYHDLLSRIRRVRKQWRMQVAIKGIALFLVAAMALLVLGIWGADLFGFRPAAVWSVRIVTGGAMLFVAVWLLWIPLSRRISDAQIARYVEERYPGLQDRLVTAVEYGDSPGLSPGMLDLLIRDALEKTRRLDFSVFLNRRRLAGYGATGVLAVLCLVALLTWGPSFFPYGFNQLYVPWSEASNRTAFSIKVSPGDSEVAKSSDLQIRAQLMGFDSPDVKLYTQPQGGTAWLPAVMEPEPRGNGFLYLLVDLQNPLRYYVEAKGVRSPVHTLKVLDLPRVENMELVYNFPAYTGMAPQTVAGEGDITALRGTRVQFHIRLNQAVPAAQLTFGDRKSVALSRGATDRDFTGEITLQQSGSYLVQAAGRSSQQHAASPEFQIEVLGDEPPKIAVTKPLRDVKATNIEEIFSEVKADDDIGVAKVELRYAVNGGAEKALTLFGGRTPRDSVTAAHTFFLEEFGLEPGDVVSYYARALDNNNVSGPGTSTSDIYFIQIRPFEQKYIQNQQGGGGGGGGEGAEALSKQQKEIISATFKLIREKGAMDPKEYAEGLKSLALVQARLQVQAQGVVDRMRRRGAAEAGQEFAKMTEYLNGAIREMEKAAAALAAQKPEAALPDEQKALQQLMRAESLFREIQVSFGNQGGGSGSQSNAEDLADLFELELNKLKNQYETVERGEQQARDEKLDEALQRLKELAQRQQQLNERNRQMASSQSGGGSSAGGSQGQQQQQQQQLMEEAERLRRQLQRLSRERSSPELNRVGDQLDQAIQAMKKSLERDGRGGSQQAGAQTTRALERLEEARRALAGGQNASLGQGLEQALQESRQLVQEQAKIQEGIDGLSQDKQRAAAAEGQRRREDLSQRKSVLADRLNALRGKLEDLSRQSQRTQKESSARVADAAGVIRDKKLAERVMSGKQLLDNGYLDVMKGREDFIRGGLEEVRKHLESAQSAMGQTKEGKLQEAVTKTRQLAEGLESMQQRLAGNSQRGGKEGRQGNAQAQQGREGQEGQEGQGEGQQGQQGQQGSSGSPQSGGSQQADGGGQKGGKSGQSSGALGQAQPPEGSASPRDARGLTANSSGPPTGAGAHGDEDPRQLRRELQQRLADAEELRRYLDRNSSHMQNLAQVIEGIKRLGAGDAMNAEQVARLKKSADLLRQLELDLSRELSRTAEKDRYYYAEDNEAPARYRKLVEEYYKALARAKAQ